MGGFIGRGGMGVVVSGFDELLQRPVAIKFASAAWAKHEALAGAFLAEARALARVRHPHVAEVFAFGFHDDVPYFVMEYFERGDLGAWIDRWRVPPAEPALDLLEQICEGLAAVHGAGLVHCDLKPSNILVGEHGRLAIADFGLASAFRATVGVPGGTPGFAAPEGRRGGEPNPLWDVFALGSVAFELLSGRPAFPHATDLETPLEAEPLARFRPDLPGNVAEAVTKALAIDPADRPSSVLEFLERCMAHRDLKPRTNSASLPLGVALVDPSPAGPARLGSLRARLPQAAVSLVPHFEAARPALDRCDPAVVVATLPPDLSCLELMGRLRRGSSRVLSCFQLEKTDVVEEDLKVIGASVCLLADAQPETLAAVVHGLVAADA